MQLDQRAVAARGAVLTAFGDLARPHGHDVAPHECPECDEVRTRLGSHAFDEVPDEDLNWLRDTIPLLGPKGLQYYLPAFLLRAIREPKWDGVEQLMLNLNPQVKDNPRQKEWWRQRLDIFSPLQRRAILTFLNWLENTSVAEQYQADIVEARDVWKQSA